MRTTARRREPQQVTFGSLLVAGLGSLGMTLARNPVAVGGTTAFLVSFAFVSANALWYQPYFHSGALISTREPVFIERSPAVALPSAKPARQDARPVNAVQPQLKPSNDTTGAIPQPRPEHTAGGDATIRQVQEVLTDLGLYQGTVDGLQGPQTRTAIGNYRRIVGLAPSEVVDEPLLRQLGLVESAPQAQEEAAVAVPSPVPPTPTPRPAITRETKPAPAEAVAPAPATAATEVPAPVAKVSAQPAAQEAIASVRLAALETEADPVIMRVQAGLKAFGNDGIRIDGLLGDGTQAAIREFQSLFGLPVTGKPDQAFLTKMREVGLIN